jgi:superfamily I DNA and/or RNA helicase
MKAERSSPSIQELLSSFVTHFQRAIRQEMDALRRRKGSFEIALVGGTRNPIDAGETGARYSFRSVSAPDDKLGAGLECTLRTLQGEYLVKVEHCEASDVTLRTERPVDLGNGQASLVIYPWFLYERLLKVFEDIDAHAYSVASAMRVFGKRDATSEPQTLRVDHSALNASQRAAVQLCSDSNLAFVWGPPGTGKTTTLAHIVSELAAQGMRTVIFSTTNAALDQALEKIAAQPGMNRPMQDGRVVRVGRSEAPTFGAAVHDVVARLHAGHHEALNRMAQRHRDVTASRQRCEAVLAGLADAGRPVQESLLDEHRPRRLLSVDGIFGPRLTALASDLRPGELSALFRRRLARLLRLETLYAESIAEHKAALLQKEKEAVEDASLILSTLTNAYFSPLMQGQRFDVVVVEEASMAILPALFYAACLGHRKTIIVGDPCQLPSIVQSDEDYVRKVMGRNIFEVAVSDPLASPLVAMLDVQYRMHPVIGSLVSDLFYAGRLKHGGDMTMREAISACEPNGGAPLVVLDTAGRTICQASAGQSRVNPVAAGVCVEIGLRALRSGAGSVAIITPYVEQARMIRALLKQQTDPADDIECSTVHRFQGQERDVVILDTVDADPMKPGVLLSERGPRSSAQNLINVAISRARGKLVIVADVRYFQERAPESVVTRMIARALEVGRLETFT